MVLHPITKIEELAMMPYISKSKNNSLIQIEAIYLAKSHKEAIIELAIHIIDNKYKNISSLPNVIYQAYKSWLHISNNLNNSKFHIIDANNIFKDGRKIFNKK